MAKIKLVATTSLLSIDRAITPTERRRLIDYADLLREVGGRSKDRHRPSRHKQTTTAERLSAAANRAVIYTLIETGMRRAAVISINVELLTLRRALSEPKKRAESSMYIKLAVKGLLPLGTI